MGKRNCRNEKDYSKRGVNFWQYVDFGLVEGEARDKKSGELISSYSCCEGERDMDGESAELRDTVTFAAADNEAREEKKHLKCLKLNELFKGNN